MANNPSNYWSCEQNWLLNIQTAFLKWGGRGAGVFQSGPFHEDLKKSSSATSKQLGCCLASRLYSLKFSSILPVQQLKRKVNYSRPSNNFGNAKNCFEFISYLPHSMSFQEDISLYFLQPFLARYVDFFRSALQLHYYRIRINHTVTEVVPKK